MVTAADAQNGFVVTHVKLTGHFGIK